MCLVYLLHPFVVHKPVCSPISSTTDNHRFEDMFNHPIPPFLEYAYTDVQAYLAAPYHYPPIPPNHNESGTLPPVTGVPGAGIPLAFPSNSTPRKWTVRPLPASDISNGDLSNNTYSFTGRVTGVDTASNFLVARIPPGTSYIPPPIESRGKREPQDRADQYQKSKKRARIPQFPCDDCGAKYVQQQGLNRHRREKHEPNLCKYCGAKWARPYEYRDHLEKHHPNVDRDMELGKVAGSRRRSAVFVGPRLQQVSLPTIEHSRRGHSGIRPYPPAVVKPSSSTATLPPPGMTYVAEPEPTQPIITGSSIPEAPPGALQDGYTVWRSPIQPRNGTHHLHYSNY
ncbi:hypothetical protein BGY98DRAFT_74378 [Russula aff. rugulosa BPL654]|nr:hypothetical protein BGY98DRAFT_74378 [Russula aff. rugulosa BPL654]